MSEEVELYSHRFKLFCLYGGTWRDTGLCHARVNKYTAMGKVRSRMSVISDPYCELRTLAVHLDVVGHRRELCVDIRV